MAESIANEAMGVEADQVYGDGNSKHGCCECRITTCVDTLNLKVPKLRQASSSWTMSSHATRGRTGALVVAVMCEQNDACSGQARSLLVDLCYIMLLTLGMLVVQVEMAMQEVGTLY